MKKGTRGVTRDSTSGGNRGGRRKRPMDMEGGRHLQKWKENDVYKYGRRMLVKSAWVGFLFTRGEEMGGGEGVKERHWQVV